MNRRDLMRGVGLGITAGTLGIVTKGDEALANTYAEATKGLPRLKITNVNISLSQFAINNISHLRDLKIIVTA